MSAPVISILGAGGWGTALAALFADRGMPVNLWGYDPAQVEKLRATRTNERHLPGVPLPELIQPTNNAGDCIHADSILFVTPSKAIRAVAEEFAKLPVPPGTPLVSCTKGIEHESGLRMSEVLREYFPRNPIGALSGPNLAAEIAGRMPAAGVIGFSDLTVAERLQPIFLTPYFRAYTSDDVAGVELGGALKNIYAIAAGVCDGLGFGDNSKAALLTRAMVELARLGLVLGGRRETFYGLSGIGDLMVTCFSRRSRNRGLGERLGRGETLEAITATMAGIAEGVPTTRSAYECARRADVSTPIIDEVHAMLFEGKEPHRVLADLMSRDPRPE
ncbi:MAG TPA: NAD(P)H-dependent glycerol-3-phosphate dehydrogenase [Chthoniobacteraceae bacterium]|jgi:glycerol-3-phosphate dehydrogenase (NAD(P)+)|nr:NAD(P)H-dependent glycerol-3-phosphate dehydrogenase [Chthoniobacteraceae bacterium]